jgi:hypothetical protein
MTSTIVVDRAGFAALSAGEGTVERGATPPNNPIKLTVHPVTHLACTRCAPGRPARYAERYAYWN